MKSVSNGSAQARGKAARALAIGFEFCAELRRKQGVFLVRASLEADRQQHNARQTAPCGDAQAHSYSCENNSRVQRMAHHAVRSGLNQPVVFLQGDNAAPVTP